MYVIVFSLLPFLGLGSTEEIVKEVNMLELGKDDIQGMDTEDGDGKKQQKGIDEGKSGNVKLKKEETSQVWIVCGQC